jgi:hypothetical protein
MYFRGSGRVPPLPRRSVTKRPQSAEPLKYLLFIVFGYHRKGLAERPGPFFRQL